MGMDAAVKLIAKDSESIVRLEALYGVKGAENVIKAALLARSLCICTVRVRLRRIGPTVLEQSAISKPVYVHSRLMRIVLQARTHQMGTHGMHIPYQASDTSSENFTMLESTQL